MYALVLHEDHVRPGAEERASGEHVTEHLHDLEEEVKTVEVTLPRLQVLTEDLR